MSANSKIEWTDATWNPVRARLPQHIGLLATAEDDVTEAKVGTHCEHVSKGCRNCYAETFNRRGLPNAGTGLDYKPGHRDKLEHFLDEKMLLAPLRRKKPTRYFLSSLTDVFGAWVSDDMLDRLFAVMALCPQHVFQVLTKRPERARDYLETAVSRIAAAVQPLRTDDKRFLYPLPHLNPGVPWWPLPNVWLGTSVEDQAARLRLLDLAAPPAAVHFMSGEPLLEGVGLTDIPMNGGPDEHGIQWLFNALTGEQYFRGDDGFSYGGDGPPMQPLDWVIVGGESGAGARPMHPDWARSLRDQCAAAGVPFFFKQWGEWGRDPIHENPDAGWSGDNKQCAAFVDGKWLIAHDWVSMPSGVCTGYGEWVYRVGKKVAGRLLDGIEHNGMPE